MEKSAKKILFFSVFLGASLWIIESCLHYFIFSKIERELTIAEVFCFELYLILFFVCFAFLCLKLIKKEDSCIVQEKILNAAQKMAHIGSWHLDIDNNTLFWSDETYRIFGLQPQEFGATYEAFLSTVHPDDREMVDRAYRNSLKDNKPYEVVHRILRPNGEVRIVHEKSENIFDESGGTHSIGMVHDITEAKNSEEEREKLIAKLQKSFSEIKTLRGIIPICSFCKKIRDDKGYWGQVDLYLKQHTEADFSHSICPECMEEHYPHVKNTKG